MSVSTNEGQSKTNNDNASNTSTENEILVLKTRG